MNIIVSMLLKMGRRQHESDLQKVSITTDEETLRISADLRGGASRLRGFSFLRLLTYFLF